MRNFSFAALSRRWTPWQGRATGADKALLATLSGALLLTLAVRPLRPFLIASHPVALEFLTGGPVTIAAAAAFARVGELPLWLVVLAGVVGMIKLDWLIWWAGRQWGRGIIGYFTTSERARRYTDRARTVRPWVVRLAVVAAALPGVPSPLVYALAGWTRMRLVTFLGLNAAGAALVTGLATALGFSLGQRAVDIVMVIDRYAGWISLAIIASAVLVPLARKGIRRLRGRPADGPEKEVGRPSTEPAGTRESRPGNEISGATPDEGSTSAQGLPKS